MTDAWTVQRCLRLRELSLTVVFVAAALLLSCSQHHAPTRSKPSTGSSGRPLPFEPNEANFELLHHTVMTEAGRAVRLVEWVTVNPDVVSDTRPVVLFVHGAPGGWAGARDIFAQSELLGAARLLSIDRLGWGGSVEGGVEPSLELQAEAVATCLRWAQPNRGAVLIGHSLGGPIVARAAMDYPDLVQGLAVLAGSVDPTLEKTTWYQAIGRWRMVRWLLPRSLRLADAEIIGLRAELEAMKPLWHRVRAPVVIVHGNGDGLVPIANVDFMERMLVNASVEVHRVRKRGHLVPWKEQRLIAERVVTMLERIHRAR